MVLLPTFRCRFLLYWVITKLLMPTVRDGLQVHKLPLFLKCESATALTGIYLLHEVIQNTTPLQASSMNWP